MCDAAANHGFVALIQNLISEPDLLDGLIEIIFHFRIHRKASSIGLEVMSRHGSLPG